MTGKLKKILLLYMDKYYLIKQVYPFGLDILANHLRRYGYEVTIEYPFLPGKDTEFNVVSILERTAPDLVGIGIRNLDTCMSCEEYGDYYGDGYQTFYFLPDVRKIVEIIKEKAPGLPIIAGGGAFTISPVAILKYLGIEYGVVGEGEEALLQFLEAFPERDKISRIPNLVYFHGNFVMNSRGRYNLLGTDRGILDRESRFNYAYETVGLPVQLKRGCNQNCSYCVEPIIEGRRYIFRGIDGVIDELRAVSENHEGIRNIFFVDTEFNVPDLNYCTKLVNKIIQTGLHEYFRFSSQFLPRPFDSDFAKVLAITNFSIILTCDSFSDAVLEMNQVSYRQKHIVETLKLCEEYNIDCTIAMVFGLPGETFKTIDHTLKQMHEYPPGFLRRYEYTAGGRIYQGTPLGGFADKMGEDHNLYGKRSEGYIEPYYYCSPDSPTRLKQYVEEGFGHPMIYENYYDDNRFQALAMGYLADQGRLQEAVSLFFKGDLPARISVYEYLFRRLADAGRIEDARYISDDLLENIQNSDKIHEYRDQMDIIRFYLKII